MLADPISLNTLTPTAPTYTVGTVCDFRKINPGKSISIGGLFSADQPAFLSTRQRSRKYGTVNLTPSDFTVRLEQHFNAAPINGVPQNDIPLIAEVRILSYPQYHSEAALRLVLNGVTSVVYNNLARLQSGEGI